MPYEDEIPPFGALSEPSAGPGLPENIYHRAMELELGLRGVPFESEKIIDIYYKGNSSARVRLTFSWQDY